MFLLDFLYNLISRLSTNSVGGLKQIPVNPGWKSGTWVALGAAAIGAGASIYGGYQAGKGGDGGQKGTTTDYTYKQLPEYPESEQARQGISGKLQEWGTQPGYGAIAPDWGEIWERAKGKVSQYYWGGAMDKGLAGKVKAGAARRGVSESPAIDTLMTRMGMSEAGQLKELAGEQSEAEATFGETGRQNWLTSMQNLAGMKPSFVTGSNVVTGPQTGTGEMIGQLGSSISGAGQQYSQNKWLENLLNQQQNYSQYGGYGGMPGTSGDIASYLGSAKQ